jgi:hypothetical protein
MADSYWNRYDTFLLNGQQTIVPYVKLPAKSSDKKYLYKKNIGRLDRVSQEIYSSPFFGWLIMLANPQFGGQEWDIPDNSILIVPFPLITSIQDYKNELNNYFFYYGR